MQTKKYTFDKLKIEIKHIVMNLRSLLLVFVLSSVLLSCSKDDDNGDYRDQFVGSYMCSVKGTINMSDVPIYLVDTEDLITVEKLSSSSLLMTFMGVSMTAQVDENGTLTIAQEKGTMTDTDPDTGDVITMDVTISYTGVITNRTFSLKETYIGNGTISGNGEPVKGPISGSIIYSGTK